jgi:hypothetical protein
MKITGMAAGFDTKARIVIFSRGCKFLSCAWRQRVNEVLEPRQYKTWTFSDNNKRYVNIDPISGESRVHLAVTWNASGGSSNPNPGQMPYQRYLFCIGSMYTPSATEEMYGSSYDDAETALRNQLSRRPLGTGDSWQVSRGACRSQF